MRGLTSAMVLTRRSAALLVGCLMVAGMQGPVSATPTASDAALNTRTTLATTTLATTMVATKKKPRAWVTAGYGFTTKGAVLLRVGSNAAVVKITYQTPKGAKRTLWAGLKKRAAQRTLPVGAHSIRVQARPTYKLLASGWVVAALNDARLAVGGFHGCAVLKNGGVNCWGANEQGQLGVGGPTPTSALATAVVGMPAAAPQVSSASGHTCATVGRGGVACWGSNFSGELGDGTTSNRPAPVAVAGIGNAAQVAAGSSHSCALLSDGAVACWGYGLGGQLGNGTGAGSPVPVLAALPRPAVQVAAGEFHTCALLVNGAVVCWGVNAFGQLGTGTLVGSATPVAVVGIKNAIAVTAGGNHSCAVLASGALRCWGLNADGQLGDGSIVAKYSPVAVAGLGGRALGVSAGSNHTCALIKGGEVRCWGDNSAGQLGDGTLNDRATPAPVIGLSAPARFPSAGGRASCALVKGGAVNCWGRNAAGQLGNGTTADSAVPVGVAGLTLN